MSERDCKMCRTRGKNWTGDDPKCAFRTGVFSSDNWNCATANALRGCVQDEIWNDDQKAAILCAEEGDFIVLNWYKNRGSTTGIWLMNGIMQPLTLEQAERFLMSQKGRRK